MRCILIAVAGTLLASAGTASAQGGLEYKPIDTSKLVVQPTEATTGILTMMMRYVSRVIADTIDTNGFVKTINNLLGRRAAPTPTTQPGFSPLPLPGAYPSIQYKNSFMPAMPTYQVYGRSPGG